MRHSNNKSIQTLRAATSITSTIYDRRALDCTEDKPLVNSLNHLTFLASSSRKVREALTQDGGLERLVDILYECRDPKTEAERCIFAWKWVLAFQSLVLVGTRGTGLMRRKVVQAGILPIAATILDNYLITRRMAWLNQLGNETTPDANPCHGSLGLGYTLGTNDGSDTQVSSNHSGSGDASIDAHDSIADPASIDGGLDADSDTPISDGIVDTQVNTVFSQVRNLLQQANRTILQAQAEIGKSGIAPATKARGSCECSLRDEEAYQGIGRCLDFIQILQALNGSASESSTSLSPELASACEKLASSPEFGAQLAYNKDVSNLIRIDPHWASKLPGVAQYDEKLNQSVPREFQHGVVIPKEDDVIWSLQLLAFTSKYTDLRYSMANSYIVKGLSLRSFDIPPPLECDEHTEGFHQSLPEQLVFDDCDYFDFVGEEAPADPFALFPSFTNRSGLSRRCDQISDDPGVMSDVSCNSDESELEGNEDCDTNGAVKATAKQPSYSSDFEKLAKEYNNISGEQDPLRASCQIMDLSLGVSRCAQREYRRLRKQNRAIHQEQLHKYALQWDYENSWNELATPACKSRCLDEVIRPIRRVNIFPLVEKFTVRRLYGKDINYWSAVIVRNSNRRDESKGGCRQCAYFGCGKWETKPRQFAKCRRCKRAKYCSKECQSKAWVYHKYWCNAVHEGANRSSSGHSGSNGSQNSISSRTGSMGSGEPVPNAPRLPSGFFGH